MFAALSSVQTIHKLQFHREVLTTIPLRRCCLSYLLYVHENKIPFRFLFKKDIPSFPLLISSLLNSLPFLRSPYTLNVVFHSYLHFLIIFLKCSLRVSGPMTTPLFRSDADLAKTPFPAQSI